MAPQNPAEPQHLGDLDDPDAYLASLLERLFVIRVTEAIEPVGQRIGETKKTVEKLSRQVGSGFEGLPRTINKAADVRKEESLDTIGEMLQPILDRLNLSADELQQLHQFVQEATDKDRTTAELHHGVVTGALNAMYEVQVDLADKRVPEALERLKELQELSKELMRRLDILRGELSDGQKRLGAAIHDVRETTEAVGNAVGDVRQAVGDVHEDVRKGHHESRQAIGELAALLDRRATAIDEAVAGLAQETERRAIAAAEETARLRRWVIAATITAALALVAAVLAVIL